VHQVIYERLVRLASWSWTHSSTACAATGTFA